MPFNGASTADLIESTTPSTYPMTVPATMDTTVNCKVKTRPFQKATRYSQINERFQS